MFNDNFDYVEKLGNSYKICIITGIILLVSFYCYAFGFSSSAKPSGIVAVLVCLSPAATAFITLKFSGVSVNFKNMDVYIHRLAYSRDNIFYS